MIPNVNVDEIRSIAVVGAGLMGTASPKNLRSPAMPCTCTI